MEAPLSRDRVPFGRRFAIVEISVVAPNNGKAFPLAILRIKRFGADARASR